MRAMVGRVASAETAARGTTGSFARFAASSSDPIDE